MSTESTYSAVIPAGATILRLVETNGVRSVEVSIPMKAAPPPSFEAVVRPINPSDPVFFGMDLCGPDESVEGIAAQPDDDVVDAEFDPGAVQQAAPEVQTIRPKDMFGLAMRVQTRPNPERPNPITAEWFKASVGRVPTDTDLAMCNCRNPGLGHGQCGWDDARDMPNFVPGRSKRPDFLLARIAELEGLLNKAEPLFSYRYFKERYEEARDLLREALRRVPMPTPINDAARVEFVSRAYAFLGKVEQGGEQS